MNENDLTKKLGALARERKLETEAWWDAAERADASRIPGPPPSIEALRPIDREERSAMVVQLFGAENVVIPMRGPRRRVRLLTAIGMGLGMAIAATVAMVAIRPGASNLPEYTLIASAGDQTLRSSEATRSERPRYTNGSRFEVVLQPEAETDEPLEVRAQLIGSRTVEWPKPIEYGRGGTFRFEAEIGTDLTLERGVWRLVVSVVPRGSATGQRIEYAFEIRDP